ncbi:type I-C CRISPR-associated protein Cas8c/Csd1 [Benzoatithermus flavus]|uniref:Type I-C CRISPR-associated protein Cas8c/Csd1 n=1 Tax=Benzoatithermus flavus TaxID=3108223 RepID=A0ABU8XP99_9PROT
MTGPLQALAARYERLAAKGELPAFGYSSEKISYALVLSPAGNLLDVQPLLDTTGRKPQPRAMLVPQGVKRTSGIASNFLWDKTSYVLGVSAKEGGRLAQEHAAFRKLHEDLLVGSDDEGLQALLAFLRGWSPERFAVPPFAPEMLDTNLVFRLDGDVFLHDRPAARDIWLSYLGSADAPKAMCLVTGRSAPVARLHPAIKGVMGAQSAGASLVSFNLDAFTSHGKEQGANAPVSEAAAFGYGATLNALLAKGSRNVVRIGDATVVFWADVPEAEVIVHGLFDPPPPDEKSEAAAVRDVLEQMARGRPIREVRPDIAEDTRFYVLGLSPNAARLSMRFWHETTFGDLTRHFQEHWQDLRLEPSPWGGSPPALWRLLMELAPQGKAENVPAHLAGELTRSVLTGGRYPRALLAAALMRMRADRAVNGRRVALCKAVIVRELRCNSSSSAEDHLVSLDRDETNPGYRLGRLFAVLEDIQRAALGWSVNATIRDRYYGAASATPASVFPLLIRNANHHLASIRKVRGGGLAYALEKEMGQILDGFGTVLPRNLGIEDQGRFAIGYYHERFGRPSGLPDDETSPDATDTDSES